MAMLLRTRGYALLEAGTVAEAVIGLAHGPEWVLLDLMLPDGNGIDVVRRIRQAKMDTRICIISGCAIEIQHEALAEGANCLIRKPVMMNELFHILGSTDVQARSA